MKQAQITIEDRLIILPGDKDYYIDSFCPDWKEKAWRNHGDFCLVGRHGLIIPATFDETTEYLYGGEYEEELARQQEIDAVGTNYSI